MKKTNPTAPCGRRFKNTPLPRPAVLTAYADDGEWSARERIECAAALICTYAATRLEGEDFPPFAYAPIDLAGDLNYGAKNQILESQWSDAARDRRRALKKIVGAFNGAQGFVAFFSRAGQSHDVAQYAEAVCDALRIKPAAHWLANPSAVCRVAISTLYLSAGKLSAAEE